MTQTSTLPNSPATNSSVRPGDMLTCLLASILAPMFLLATEGDITFARAAALETITGHRPQSTGGIISAAETIAFGIAAVSSLSLSMAENLSIPLILKLRGNANGLNRSISRAERSLGTPYQAAGTLDEATIIASVAELKTRTAAATAGLQPAAARSPQSSSVQPAAVQATQPVPVHPGNAWASQEAQPAKAQTGESARARPATPRATKVQPAPIQPPQNTTKPESATLQSHCLTTDAQEQRRRAGWASAMTEVAGEYIADIPNLPLVKRREATIRAAALSSTANALLLNEFSPRAIPGELAALLQSKKT